MVVSPQKSRRCMALKFKSIFYNIKHMFKAMWKFSKVLFAGKFFLAVLNGIIAPINALLIKVLIENITKSNFKTSLITIVIMMLFNLLSGFFTATIRKKIGILVDLFKNKLLFDFYSKIADMDYEILYNPDMIQNKNMALQAIQGGLAINYLNIMFSCFSAIITFISIIYLLSSISAWVYILVVFLTLIRVFTVIIDKKRKYKTTLELSRVNTENSYYMNILTDEVYVNDIKMFSVSEWIMNKSKDCILGVQNLLHQLLDFVYKNDIIRNVLSCIEMAFPYVYVTAQMIFNKMSFANFSLITTTLKNLTNSVTNITNSLVDLGENSAYVKIYIDFMKVENIIAIPNKGIPIEKIENTSIVFELKNVSFKYPSSKNFVLKDINLKIEQDNFYVIVGGNGAGKTTLVRLLCRLYDVTNGSLLYMGTNVKDIEYKSYRNNIGVVFQDYKYYCLSIAENVAMNDYQDSPEIENRILNALENAGLGEKIASLPNGIYTQLGKIFDNEGILLSGGELQKLALARVLFKNPAIVILDEPSSALDAFAEDELITTFNSVLKNKTVIYISHRLSVANYADKVIYIQDGTIKGFDTHKNLLNNLPPYRDMYEAQAKHYS